ncbi:hypothetical protein L1987_74055 [Smallanthus sonchifolius]|uniref:Uncharacterized protein n=1 Tax=Smallanthus sonchifolius TaxID=185202 RepID=A0ACB9A0X6_9ASTR|nr:hypothetical protein L1987_74055 [Smallanthus sonchifolius]
MVRDMNLRENATVNGGGGGGGRRRSKADLTQRKNKQPQRGMGVEQLERIRLQDVWKKMTHIPSLHPQLPFPTSYTTVVPNVAVQFRPTPAMLFSTDHVMDPSAIGSNNAGFRSENSIPNFIRCGSDACGVSHKKKRINGGSYACSMNQFRNICGNNGVVEIIDAGKSRRGSGQVNDRNGGSLVTEYEFFPGKGGGDAEGYSNYTELMSMGSKAWCASGSGASVGGMIGLRGGEGSCVTAVSGSEEGSVSSVDLSLKLSY